MATTAVSLASLGEIANWIDRSVTTMLTGVITPMIAEVTEKIIPVVTIGLSIALLWYGWLIMSGAIQTPVLAATRRIVNIGVITGIAVNAFFFVLFEVWFKVPLFKGTLEPLRFLGY